MKIVRHIIPEKNMNSMLLFVRMGSFSDGEYSGLSHLLEHMLVAFDKERSMDDRRVFDVSAQTSYDYMVFIIKYDYTLIGKEAIRGILSDIKNAKSISYEKLSDCKADVIEEIEKLRSGKEKTMKMLGDKSLIKYLSIGRVNDIERINEQIIKDHINKYFLNADKFFADISYKRNKYNIEISDEAGNPFNASNENMPDNGKKHELMEYLYEDLLFLMCKEIINEYENRRCYLKTTNVLGKNHVIVRELEIDLIKDVLNSRKVFNKKLAFLRRRYFSVSKFDIDNINRIIIDSLADGNMPFDLPDVKKILLKKSDYIYKGYCKWLEDVQFNL